LVEDEEIMPPANESRAAWQRLAARRITSASLPIVFLFPLFSQKIKIKNQPIANYGNLVTAKSVYWIAVVKMFCFARSSRSALTTFRKQIDSIEK
jgi:hypothetical protein